MLFLCPNVIYSHVHTQAIKKRFVCKLLWGVINQLRHDYLFLSLPLSIALLSCARNKFNVNALYSTIVFHLFSVSLSLSLNCSVVVHTIVLKAPLKLDKEIPFQFSFVHSSVYSFCHHIKITNDNDDVDRQPTKNWCHVTIHCSFQLTHTIHMVVQSLELCH